MYDDYIKPSTIKLMEFKQLQEYCVKYNKTLSRELLRQNNFNVLEINWLYNFKAEEIKMSNEKIVKELKARIVELEKLNTKIETVVYEETKPNIEFKKVNDEWIIIEKYGDRKLQHYIAANDVMNVWNIIKKETTRDQPKISYRTIIINLINKFNLHVGLDAFNGGKNRAKYYFKIYYYPLKVLQHLKLIKYNGGGVTTRLSFGVQKYAEMIRGKKIGKLGKLYMHKW